MDFRNFFKISRKTFFYPSGWLDYQALNEQTRDVKAAFKETFSIEKPSCEESFDEAMRRLKITPAELEKQKIFYRHYSLIFFLLALLVFFYSFFLLFYLKYIIPWFMGLAVSGVLFAQAFKFHFWSFLIDKRQLGLTFKDWKQYILNDKSHTA